MRAVAAALAGLLALGACAAPPPVLPVVPAAAAVAAPMQRPRLWYVGLGMQGESWSENDVVETAERLAAVVSPFEVRPLILSNRLAGQKARYPAVDGPAVEQAMTAIAAAARPGDVVLLYVSTHGAPGLLGRETAGRPQRPVGTAELRQWLAPLAGRDTVVILSACFSGSFIPALAEPHRIIITAARADRTSFGCQAGAVHTIFGDALLQALTPGRSLETVVERTRETVSAQERAMRFTPPSLPQVAVGNGAQPLYEAPVF